MRLEDMRMLKVKQGCRCNVRLVNQPNGATFKPFKSFHI